MNIFAITFDGANDKLIVIAEDGAEREYTREQAKQYIQDTGREDDVIAMGWNT
jgi:hypothetical protein